MIIARGRASGAPSARRSETFTGEVWLDPVLPPTDGVMVNAVVFTPRARTFWHRHEQGQLLVVTAGAGYVCAESGAPELVRAGDVVWAPPGERHWHGAGEDTYLSHVAVSLGKTLWETEVER
jgi:quercetin dioxygenase-like cupin family protein